MRKLAMSGKVNRRDLDLTTLLAVLVDEKQRLVWTTCSCAVPKLDFCQNFGWKLT